VVLSVFLILMNLANNRDVWTVAKGAALPFLGVQRVMQPGFEAGPVLLGTLSHFAVSAAWGLLFGLLFFGLRKGATLFAGAFWGIIVWLGMYYVVLPLIGAGQVARSTPVGSAVLIHLLFGLGVGIAFLPFQRTRPRAEPPMIRRAPVSP
jgi:hypothetical protein